MTHEFSIAAAQSSSVKEDITENVRTHAEFVACAAKHAVNVVVFPELSLTGYEPTIAADAAIDVGDSALRPLQEISDRFGIAIITGCPIRPHEIRPYLGAFIIQPKSPTEIYRKRFLHGDEVLYFIPGDDTVVCSCHDRTVGVAICADISKPTHASDAANAGATIYAAGVAITPSGIVAAETQMSQYARSHNLLAVMANYATETGGYPPGGRSAIWDESGQCLARGGESGECLVLATATGDQWKGSIVEL